MFLCVFWFRVLYITSFSIQISLQFTPIQYNPIKYNGQSQSLSLDYCVGVGVRLSYIRFIIMESEMMTIIFRKKENKYLPDTEFEPTTSAIPGQCLNHRTTDAHLFDNLH